MQKNTVEWLAAQIRERLPNGGLICLTGTGGAGKTTLARELAVTLGETAVYPFDGVYIPFPIRRAWRDNGEPVTSCHPRALELPLAEKILTQLKTGKDAPVFSDDTRLVERKEIATCKPKRYTIVDGLGAYRPELRGFYDLAIFVESSADVELQRRLLRDTAERNQNEEQVREAFAARRRQYEQFIAPGKEHAHIVLNTDKLF